MGKKGGGEGEGGKEERKGGRREVISPLAPPLLYSPPSTSYYAAVARQHRNMKERVQILSAHVEMLTFVARIWRGLITKLQGAPKY